MGEISYQASKVAGENVNVTFVPHLMPMNRGIHATIYAKLTKEQSALTTKELVELYKKFYKDAAFVRIVEGIEPCTKNVSGTNYCDIGVAISPESKTVVVMSVIDNLIKGAAGQAVQNMNLMYGFEESLGLKLIAIYP